MATPTPPDPEPPKKATLRARTRTNPVRPEVIDALDELERSLGDVSRWEQLLTGKESASEWERPGTAPALGGEHFGPSHLAPADPDDIDTDSAVALEEAIRNLDDRIEGIRADAPMLQAPEVGPAPEGLPYQLGPAATVLQPVQASPMILQSARTVEPAARRAVVTPEEEDEIDRRRRNGRALTWVGLALLVALGGVFFLPKSNDGDTPEAPAVTVTVPTTAPFATAPLLPTEDTTTIPLLPVEDTSTTAATKTTTASTKKPPTVATTPVVTQPPAPSSTSTLVVPGPASTTTAPTTPPTEPVDPPSTTTTTIFSG